MVNYSGVVERDLPSLCSFSEEMICSYHAQRLSSKPNGDTARILSVQALLGKYLIVMEELVVKGPGAGTSVNEVV